MLGFAIALIESVGAVGRAQPRLLGAPPADPEVLSNSAVKGPWGHPQSGAKSEAKFGWRSEKVQTGVDGAGVRPTPAKSTNTHKKKQIQQTQK